MKKHWSLVVVTVLLACAGAAFAYPNLNGLTGIVAVPNAYLQDERTLSAAADVLFLDTTTLNVRALYGLSNRFEVGALAVFAEDTGVGASLKYQFGQIPGDIMWAAGISVNGVTHGNSGTQIFVVGTKAFPVKQVTGCQVLGSVGINFTNVEDTDTQLFVGAQVGIASGTELGGEYEFSASSPFDHPIVSLVVRHQFGERFVGEAGFTNANGFFGEENYAPFLGIGSTF